MPHQVKWHGAAGRLLWGYHVAATLGAWSLEGDALDAAVVSRDAFKLNQRPLVFEVKRPKGQAWTWPVTFVDCSDRRLSAVLVVD